jgi:hypothetical protein
MKHPPTAIPSVVVPASFNYSQLDTHQADWLRVKTNRLRGYTATVASFAVKIGLELIAVKGKLSKGTFRRWARAELPWSLSKTNNFMRVGRVFETAKSVEQFSPSALYLLCWPSAPAAARHAALALADEGKDVSRKTALELIALHTPRQPGADLDDDDSPAPPPVVIVKDGKQVQTLGDRNWADFMEVMEEFDTLHISKTEDTENGLVEYMVTGYPKDQSAHLVQFSRTDLADAFAAMLGEERTKECPHCVSLRGPLPLDKFCLNRLESDGRNRICRSCESERRQEVRDAAKAKRQQPETAA